MKSIQTTQTNNEELKGKIGLYLECRKCGTGRTYLIEENLKLLALKKIKSFNIDVECEKCKNIISVGLGWIEEKEGYSYLKRNLIGKNGLQVLDNNGLAELKEVGK